MLYRILKSIDKRLVPHLEAHPSDDKRILNPDACSRVMETYINGCIEEVSLLSIRTETIKCTPMSKAAIDVFERISQKLIELLAVSPAVVLNCHSCSTLI